VVGPSARFSIVTVCFNPGETIDACLRSVADQGYPHIEHIVIDGASPDGTAERIGKLDWFKGILVSEPDKGIYDAMNKGVARATGDYVGFLNADDWLADPDAVARLAEAAAENPGADAVQGDVVIVDPAKPRRQRYYSGAGNWRRLLHAHRAVPRYGRFCDRLPHCSRLRPDAALFLHGRADRNPCRRAGGHHGDRRGVEPGPAEPQDHQPRDRRRVQA
jgi:glycosyltransferase involved in cell wall biosynthesis